MVAVIIREDREKRALSDICAFKSKAKAAELARERKEAQDKVTAGTIEQSSVGQAGGARARRNDAAVATVRIHYNGTLGGGSPRNALKVGRTDR